MEHPRGVWSGERNHCILLTNLQSSVQVFRASIHTVLFSGRKVLAGHWGGPDPSNFLMHVPCGFCFYDVRTVIKAQHGAAATLSVWPFYSYKWAFLSLL